MNTGNQQQTGSILEIVEKIDQERIVLPEFQRDFQWDESRTYKLFDSLVRNIFIGSLIYGIPSFEISVRDVDKRPRKKRGKKREEVKAYTLKLEDIKRGVANDTLVRIVLDGQQRLTSIYRAIKGIDDVWFIAKDDSSIEKLEDSNLRKLTLEDVIYRFCGKEDESRLSIKLSDVFNGIEDSLMDEEKVEQFFEKSSYYKTLEDEEDINNEKRKYQILTKKLEDLFKEGKLVSYFLLDMNSEKFALFFERSNSLGVKLDFIDILVAKLNSGFKLKKKLKELSEEMKDDDAIEREVLVRSIAYKVSKENSSPQIDKGYILKDLNPEHFVEHWNNTVYLYKETINFLSSNNFLIVKDWMPHSNMLTPLMVFLDNLDSKDFSQMNNYQLEFITYWYWASIFSQKYTGGATNEVIIEDCNNLAIIARGEKIRSKRYFTDFRCIIQDHPDLQSYSKKGSAIYKGILNLINFNSKGLWDWKSKTKINFNSKIDDHHIFPKQFIADKYNNSEDMKELVDCVLNKTLIPKISNIKIGKKAPSLYMNNLKNENENLEQCIESHLIPKEILNGKYDDLFEVFLEERGKIIFNIIKSTVIDKKQYILNNFYEEIKIKTGNQILLFGSYKNTKVDAKYYIDTKEIVFNGETYKTPTAAAKAARKFISPDASNSVNGREFWKFKDGGEIKKLKDL